MLELLFFPILIMFGLSFIKSKKTHKPLAFISFLILIPTAELLRLPKPFHLLGDYLVVDDLNAYILFVSSIVGIGVALALMTLDRHVKVSQNAYRRFYRFFAIFWVGLIFSILSIKL